MLGSFLKQFENQAPMEVVFTIVIIKKKSDAPSEIKLLDPTKGQISNKSDPIHFPYIIHVHSIFNSK
jgi:hypothetical protein